MNYFFRKDISRVRFLILGIISSLLTKYFLKKWPQLGTHIHGNYGLRKPLTKSTQWDK